MIPLSRPYITGREIRYIQKLLKNKWDLSGDGIYTKRVHEWFTSYYGARYPLLTTSGTTALELAVWLMHFAPGDEVIAPSFTFSSTVNAILLQKGVRVRFVDIDAATLNIDPEKIREAITKKTRGIMVVHYAGVSANMGEILSIAKTHQLKIIEDAAQGLGSFYKRKRLGTLGDVGCISFHGTKNITCGEGGMLLINTSVKKMYEEAEIVREKGTNRTKFIRGLVDKYTWVSLGSSYLPSELNAAFLYAQLESFTEITHKRIVRYDVYKKNLEELEQKGKLRLPVVPDYARHNAHIFYILLPSSKLRDQCMQYLRERGIGAAFHYIPLHNAPFSKKNNLMRNLPVTIDVSRRLLRLPLYSSLTQKEQMNIITTLFSFLKKI